MSTSVKMSPQAWWEVVSPPPELAQQCCQLVSAQAAEGPLTTAQLAVLVQQIVARPELWEPLEIRDAGHRRYRLLYEDDRIDVWVLSWMEGQGTGFHDHDLSGVALIGARGMVVERQMLLPSGATQIEMEVGVTREGGPGYIHSVCWGRGEPAISIHAYSPPLLRVGQFVVDEEGILQRHSTHGRQELMDNTIAERDPSRA